MQLRYKETIVLKKKIKVKQSNGVNINDYTDVKPYVIEKQDMFDEVSASIYGTTINKMYRISSARHILEAFLKPLINNTKDNISDYKIAYNNGLYKIVVVKDKWIDIEFEENL